MRSWLRVDAVAGRVPRWRSEGVFTVRLTGEDQVHIVSAAAGPLGGDEVVVEVHVGEGASLTVRGVAASVALPGSATDRSSWSWELDVAEGGRLLLEPQPVIVAGRAAHHGATALRLASGASAVLVEQAQIGRFGEAEGAWRGSLAVDVDGQELLRHAVELGEGSATWDRGFAPAAIESEFRYPDDRPAWVGMPEPVRAARRAQRQDASALAARLPLAGGGSLTTRLSSRLVDM
ncbi:MAG: urease accessory protein UreD [Segniliparus sp.]|uniref:urease accessory protein UreD n=1 Tax=Segniliparus sp. TaxID=2804064 RepID=UPI003F3AE9A9